MTLIPPGTKFHGVDPSVPTRDKKSALLNSYSEAYTIEDIIAYFQAINLGWCRYDDDQYTPASKLSINDGVEVVIPNNGATTYKSDPTLADFYDTATQKLVSSKVNDVYIVSVVFKASSSNANQTHLEVSMSGPAGYERINESIGFYKGNDEEQNIHRVYQYYTDPDFVSNGAQLKVSSVGGNSKIWDVIFFIQRTQLGASV